MSRLLLSVVVLLPSLGFAWGFDGHRALASMMQEPLAADSCLRQWFAARQTTALQDGACDPDRWRYPSAGDDYDVNEAPRHYLEIDWVTPPTLYPRTWDEVVAQLGGYYATKNGVVPWHVETMYARLVDDFRSKDTARILRTAFLMSHYVFDGFSVFHDTKDFDPGPGLHARWESDMLGPASNRSALATQARGYFGTVGRVSPRDAMFDIVLVGNGLAPQVVALAEGTTTNAQLFAATRDLTARRWGDGLTVMASLLWSAWADAGAPELQGFSQGCSRAVPEATAVIVGYPPPGGFTQPTGGGAGEGGGSASGGGPAAGGGDAAGGGEPGWAGGGVGGGATQEEPPPGCGCGGVDVTSLALFAAVAWLGVWRRRRRLQ